MLSQIFESIIWTFDNVCLALSRTVHTYWTSMGQERTVREHWQYSPILLRMQIQFIDLLTLDNQVNSIWDLTDLEDCCCDIHIIIQLTVR
jgi:hypothetical protein